MKVFENYSDYYDLLYRDKNYAEEVDYVLGLINKFISPAATLLDIGCGTGKHAALFATKGLTVSGLDLSEKMLYQARANYPQINFYHADARSFTINQQFDVITSLFHVASYQTTNQDIQKYLLTINKHLNDNGVFVFDFWYAPAVFNDKPVVRLKKLENEKLEIFRIAEPVMHQNANIVDVNYQILIKDKQTNLVETLNEKHVMRYFSLPEISYLLESNGFTVINTYKWLTNNQPDGNSWSVCVIARKKC